MTWYLDGVNLSTLAWNIKERSAGWTVPGKTGSNIKVPGKHGSFWVPDKTFDEGELTLSMWAAGTNEDGTLPLTEDGKKKVRDNLDALTSMFAVSRRLLNLRQVTGSGEAMVNEVINPTMTSSSSSGYPLATNNVLNAGRTNLTTTEISQNIFYNPLVKGRSTTLSTITEDLYPDPGCREHQADADKRVIVGFYSPINQDAAGTNRFFKTANGFTWKTGPTGSISLSSAKTFGGSATVGYFQRPMFSHYEGGVMLLNIKVADSASTSSVTFRVTPSISTDGGISWTDGTYFESTVDKTDYTWIIAQKSSLPTLPTSGDYLLRYRFTIIGASSWGAGDVFHIDRAAIQSGPPVGSPWENLVNPSMIIDAAELARIEFTQSENLSWSAFQRPPAPAWEAISEGTTSTTAPYAVAWSGRDTSRDEGHTNFSVFGGPVNTFRRVLPSPTVSMDDVKIWGKLWSKTPDTATARITERTGTEGSYVYTSVRSVSIPSLATSFSSEPFSVTAGSTYCLEFDVPASGDGFEPSLIMREIHVSNGYVNTTLPTDSVYAVWGHSSQCAYSATVYDSTILGKSYDPYGFSTGVSHKDMRSIAATNAVWDNDDVWMWSKNGTIVTEDLDFPSYASEISLRTTVALGKFDHADYTYSIPTSMDVDVDIEMLDSGGSTLRTLSTILTNVPTSYTTYDYTAAVNANEVAARVTFSYDNTGYAMSELKVQRLHVMIDKPTDIGHFTGSEISSTTLWTRSAAWSGTPYFSTSRMTVALPGGWEVDRFDGFDSDDRSIMVAGDYIRVPINVSDVTAYVGLRRGEYTADFTVSAQPEGAGSPTSLGTITSGTDFAQAMVTIPSGASYVDFHISGSGTYHSVKDVFVMGSWNSFFPIPSSGWVGFYPTSVPTLVLPAHPSSRFPRTSVITNLDTTLSYSTGDVQGWDGDVLSGGYLIVPESGETNELHSNVASVDGTYASAAVLVQAASDAVNKIVIRVEAATEADYALDDWTTVQSSTVSTTSYQEVKLQDIPVSTYDRVRLTIVGDNTSTPLTRDGVLGIIDGATLTISDTILGANFPGYFIGVRASDGTSTYQGDIRQCFAEVTQVIDMQSTGLATIAEFNVNLTVPGAFWEDVYDTQTTLTANGGFTSGTFYVSGFEGATAPMDDVVFEVTPVSGTLTEFRIEDVGSGNYLEYDGPSSDKFTIDTELAAVTNSDGLSVIQYVPSVGSSTILSLTPYVRSVGESIPNHINGTPILKWSANVPIEVTITGRRKYLIG